ncbi:unnamed protein product, partial [Brassica napus]
PNEETPERIPASHRLGPVNEAHSAFDRLGPLVSPLERVELPRSVQTPLKRKPGRPSLRRATPLSLAMISACIRKRRVSKATKSSKTIPCNEENTTKTIPRREENSSRTMPKKSRGLALIWKDWLSLEVISSCNSYFDTRVTYEGNVSYATFVYA